MFFLIQCDLCSQSNVECLSNLKVMLQVNEVDKESEVPFSFFVKLLGKLHPSSCEIYVTNMAITLAQQSIIRGSNNDVSGYDESCSQVLNKTRHTVFGCW